MRRRLLIILFLIFVITCNFDFACPSERYFYKGRDFGSEALYNPINVILNGGYDIMQLDGYSHDIRHFPYRNGSKNVWRNIANPGGPISRYGWRDFLSNEVFPVSLKKEYMQWLPNYQLHLIGGGMTYRGTFEWYDSYGFPLPRAFSIASMGVYHFLNETVENGSYQGDNVDPISDILIFDAGGVILFSFDNINKFFSEKLNLSDWSLMPSFAVKDLSIQNHGQNFAVKWKVPRLSRWYLFHYFGMTNLTGLSFKKANGDCVSFGGGVRTKTLIMLDENRRRETISAVGNVGLFYDRGNSLLCSILFGGSADKRLNINVYPGVLKLGRFSPGLWTFMNKDGDFTFGLITAWTPGIAIK